MATMTDGPFPRALYKTLRSWDTGSRGSRLKPFEEFGVIISGQHALARFERAIMDYPSPDLTGTTDALWTLLLGLPIVENSAMIVPVTKALPHVLPELVVPMDRQYPQVFFGWHDPRFQYVSATASLKGSVHLSKLPAVNPSKYLNNAWNSYRTKVVDYALVGLLRWVKDHVTPDSG